jgi:hypothetical protein
VHRAAERSQEDGSAETYALSQGGGVGEKLDWVQRGHAAENLLHHPHAVVSEAVDAAEERPDLGDGDGLAHEGLWQGDRQIDVGGHSSLSFRDDVPEPPA